ncbi:MAG: hypothetical protein GEU80_13065 [Dehalococcoidia bacterium]|nr:hypothetical protein [Dehalococcoidia bacterium]
MGAALIGLGLIGLGVILLGDQAGYWDGGDVISTWWPLGIVAIGVVQLASRPRPWLGAGIVIAIGVLLLLTRVDILPEDTGRLFWPALLIVIGGWMLVTHFRGRRPPSSGEGTVNVFAVFGEANSASNSPAFAGGSVTAVLGGAKLDLRQATPVAEGAELTATGIFGGAEVVVPRGWDLRVHGLPIFGGVDDQTMRDGESVPGAPRLTVKGLAVFGSVEVKDAG